MTDIFSVFGAIDNIQKMLVQQGLLLNTINKKVDTLMTEVSQAQADINNAVTVFGGLLTDIQAQTAQLVTDLQNLQTTIQNGQPVDTTALDSTVSSAQAIDQALDAAVQNVTQLSPPSTTTGSTTPAGVSPENRVQG